MKNQSRAVQLLARFYKECELAGPDDNKPIATAHELHHLLLRFVEDEAKSKRQALADFYSVKPLKEVRPVLRSVRGCDDIDHANAMRALEQEDAMESPVGWRP